MLAISVWFRHTDKQIVSLLILAKLLAGWIENVHNFCHLGIIGQCDKTSHLMGCNVNEW